MTKARLITWNRVGRDRGSADARPAAVATLLALVVTGALAASATPGPATNAAPPSWAAKPAPADAVTTAVVCRVVDYGDDFAWNYNQHQYRGGLGIEKVIPDVDVDGDGKTNDCIAYWPFSLETPLNPLPPTWDTEAASAVFYGGFLGFFAHTRKSQFSEMCTNVDHPGDNITMMVQNWREPYRAYGLWLWKKQDFLNGGDRYPVTFDAQSRIGLHLARYCTDVRGRFVIRDAGQFYISEPDFQGAGEDFVKTGKGDNSSGYTHVLYPARVRWARYDPAPPRDIAFRMDRAPFAVHEFKDVDVAGYLFAKEDMTPGSTWLKILAFEVYGTVHRPARPSELLDMVAVPAGEAAGGRMAVTNRLWMSRCEIPYSAWQHVQRWAVSPMFAFDWNYVFDRDGHMGSMDFGEREHGPDEPVTDITLLDAVAWCNALSEREGKTPAYYADAAFGTVFKKVRERSYDRETNARYVPKVFVKWTADGYRLPTATEWAAVCRAGGTADREPQTAAATTHDVGTAEPNALGLYDMIGNVWEYVWTYGDAFDGARRAPSMALGGDFHGTNSPLTVSASPFGDRPWRGSHNVGFRVVRGGGPNADSQSAWSDMKEGYRAKDDALGVPAWTFGPGTETSLRPATTSPAQPPAPMSMTAIPAGNLTRVDDTVVSLSAFDMSPCEVTWADWKRVRDWAESHGYAFNYDGDMGSMYREAGRHRHGPREPVTRISAYDAFAWCNALSEMEGRTPCYFTDPGRTNLYRDALPYREAMTFHGAWGDGVRGNLLRTADNIVVNWAADGYRLPTRAEWQYAYLAGASGPYPWGKTFRDEYAWFEGNSGGTTHPAATREPNAFGLYDMAGNVFERCWGNDDDPYDTQDPKGRVSYGSSTVFGGSFRYPAQGQYAHYFQAGWGPSCVLWGAYPEIGLRLVRCKAGTHTADGYKPVDRVLLDVDTSAPADPLQGKTFRGNLQRTGVWETHGVPALHGERWAFRTGGPVRSSPIVVDGAVIFGSDDRNVYSVDAASGRARWSFKTGGPVTGSPTWSGGVVYIGSCDGRLYALDAARGEKLWDCRAEGSREVTGSPVVAYGAVFEVFEGWGYKTGLIAIDAQTGKPRCLYRGVTHPSPQAAYALAAGGRLVHACHGSQGSVTDAVDIRTGRTTPLKTDRTYGTGAVSAGTLYGAGMCVTAVDIGTGNSRYLNWIEGEGYRDAATERSESRSSVALWNGTLYFGNEAGGFFAYDAQTGKRRWKTQIGDRLRSPPSVAEGIVYVGCQDGRLIALDAASGDVKWSFPTGGPIVSSPCVADGAVYVGSDDGALHAIE